MLDSKRVQRQKEFIEKSTALHSSFYDYSLVYYTNNKTKVKIICPVHGVFEQRPDNHYHQHCPCCKSTLISLEDFTKRSKEIHNNFYDYSMVNFISLSLPVKILNLLK